MDLRGLDDRQNRKFTFRLWDAPCVSSPPDPDAGYRYSTATLEWARDEHATLREWPARRATPDRLRAVLLTRALRSLFDRLLP